MKRVIAILVLLCFSISIRAQTTPSVVTMQNAATATGNGTAIVVGVSAANPGANLGAVGVQIVGTFSATITFEATTDGTNWTPVMATNLEDDVRATTATAAGQYTILYGSAIRIRARISSYSSGSVTVKGRLIPGLTARLTSGGGGGGGSGDVVGPASATDNAVARFNLTTGKLIQNSVVTIGDTGDTAGVANLTFTGVLTGGSAPTTITDSAGKILSAALNTVQPAQGGTGITALGTGIATALGVNIGSAGAPVLFDGAGGTPSGIVLTNATGLPLSTGVTGDLPFANFVQAGSAGFVGATGAGDYSHRTPTQVTAALDAFVGDSGSGGTKGLVPAPTTGDATKYLKGDGTWGTVSASPGGSDTQLQRNNAGAFGGISGATSDGTNVTFGSGNLLATSPAFTTNQTTTNDAIGTTSTDGIVLQNTTAAAAGAQQYSPRLRLTGQGWKTNATAASQTVDFVFEVQPVQGAANPTGWLALQSQVNAGGYSNPIYFGTTGRVAIGGLTSSFPMLKNVSGTLEVKDSTDASYKPIRARQFQSGDDTIWMGQDYGGIRAGSGIYIGFTSTTNAASATPDSVFYRAGVSQIRIGSALSVSTPGSLILGSSTVGSIGTSGVGVLAIANGTAPTSSPADEFQLYSADSTAGTANAYIRNEAGEINRISGLSAINTSAFSKTSDTTLANITGLTRNVEAGRTYAFRAEIDTTANVAGGVKFAVSGTATATSINYSGVLFDGTAIVANDRATALDTTVCASTTSTAGTCTIKGVVVINSGGTLTIQFAQNASDGGASTVLVNQYFQLIPIS